ncbi:40S ribosomal protein S6 [Gossypium australe]|uniref:40S ribosomal protein S6 n=1 Tax=Gossypium australe TaxID=47621 RepID=A0A5B6WNY2_9ROSI|nr:40S ribosomal protein S6 [Gossypium australe]
MGKRNSMFCDYQTSISLHLWALMKLVNVKALYFVRHLGINLVELELDCVYGASAGTPCFRGYGRRNGERRKKAVCECIGENELPALTDTEKTRMRGPKRASKIRKLFNLSKEDDVWKYVNTYRRTFTTKSGKKVSKAQKIQWLVTPLTLQRKRDRIAEKKRITKAEAEAAEYQKLLSMRLKEQRERVVRI